MYNCLSCMLHGTDFQGSLMPYLKVVEVKAPFMKGGLGYHFFWFPFRLPVG